MSYSEDNISAQPAEMEYSARSRRRAQTAPESGPAPVDGAYRRRNAAVPLPGTPARPESRQDAPEADMPEDYRAREARSARAADVDEPERTERRRPAAARARREEPEYYDDIPEAEDDARPRNRFMAWLESLRIVEEVPQDEDGYADEDYGDERRPERGRRARDEYDDHGDERRPERGQRARDEYDDHGDERRPARRAREDEPEEDDGQRDERRARRAGVPVPTGRQRRGEIAEYTEDIAEADERADEDERRAQADANEPSDVSRDASEDTAAPVAEEAAGEPEATGDEYAEPEDAEGEPVPVSRRARRSASARATDAAEAGGQAEVAGQADAADRPEPADPAPEAQYAEPEGESLEQRYISASIEGKRSMLFEHWQEQFAQNLVIPAKDDKLRSITDMVDKILKACPDEYALGERWEKIEELLGRYSSAVVAEYGYRALLTAVQAEEQQRMYGRPSDAPDRAAPQTPRLGGRSATEAPAAAQASRPERRAAEPRQERYDGHPDEREERPAPESGRSVRRGYGSEFDYEPERKRGTLSRLIDRVKERGAHEHEEPDEYPADGSRVGRLKQLFRRGDVLDYSSDEPEEGLDDFDSEPTAAAQDEPEAGYNEDADVNDGYAASLRNYSRDDYAAPERSYNRDDYAAPERSYNRDDYAAPERSYSRDDYAAPERSYNRDDYATPERTNSRDDYSAPEQTLSQDTDYASARSYDQPRQRDDSQWQRPVDRSVYDESSEDYSADRPDYSQDYADADARLDYAGSYARSGYGEGGYARAESYDRGYIRQDAADRPMQRDYGERGYRTRPQGGTEEQAGEDSDDRWRRCSPTRDDGDGMGASQRGTEEADRACAKPRARGLMNMLGRAMFVTALADEEEDAASGEDAQGGEPPTRDVSRVGKRRERGVRLGAGFRHEQAKQRGSGSANADAASQASADGASPARGASRGVRLGARWRNTAGSYLALVGTLALIVALGAGAYVARVVYEVRRYDDAFYQGAYLDGMELTGMSLEEAESAVGAHNAERVGAVHLSVTCAGERFDMDSAGLKVTLDTRERLEELWRLGREGGIAERYRQIVRLREEGAHAYTSLRYSEAALDDFLSGIKAAVDLKPRDATIKFRPNATEKFTIGESAAGREVDLTALQVDARAALADGSFALELMPKRLEPAFTTADARACTGKLVTYSTKIHSSNASRTANIKLALSFYHGLRVEPGQRVDFNKLVGARTEARGFKPAPEYSNGEIVDGIGGGVCQASTTLYGALLRAGLRIDERYNHSMTVGYVPRSQDAAVVYPGKTLTFTNTTGSPVFFVTSVTAEKATVTVYGRDIYPGKTISIESETISVDEARVDTYSDPDFQYTTEPGQIVTVTTPSDGVTSRAYRVLTDDATGKVVSRELLSKDTYRRRDGVRYRGGT